MKNPQACPICKSRWDFKTDDLGRLYAVHPITKCTAPISSVYEKEDEGPSWERKCIECTKMFSPRKGRGNAETCGAKCRKARNHRIAREWNQKHRKAA